MFSPDVNVARDLLLAHQVSGGDWDNFPAPAKRQFRYVGSGSYRTAYLHNTSGTIYKIDNAYSGNGSHGGNLMELRALERAADMLPLVLEDGTIVRIPEAQGFRFGDKYVVAMEYVPDPSQCTNSTNSDYEAIGNWYQITDSAPGSSNVRLDADGALVLTDCGLTDGAENRTHTHADCEHCCHQGTPLPEPHVVEYAFA